MININIVGVDIETTGVDINVDEIVQFGCKRRDKNGKERKLEFLCKPSIPIPIGASEVHGITNEMVANEKPFSYYADQVKTIMLDALIYGYNIKNFDLAIIDRQLTSCGLPGIFDQSIIFDTFEMFKLHNTRTLADAHRFYGCGELQDAHDAIADIEGTERVMMKQIEREGKDIVHTALMTCPPPEKRVGWSSHIVFDESGDAVLTFGKHKGRKCKDVDPGFFVWMQKTDFPSPVKNFVKQFI